ncbi:hypothetical protein, partial [Escherichia coli]|uniref:hypothetical protein n=1 Tax=Escherichia coli TaxID=562 RepID=UPI001BC91AD4
LFLPQYFLTELQIAEYSALSLLTPTRGIGFISDANTQEVKKKISQKLVSSSLLPIQKKIK